MKECEVLSTIENFVALFSDPKLYQLSWNNAQMKENFFALFILTEQQKPEPDKQRSKN